MTTAGFICLLLAVFAAANDFAHAQPSFRTYTVGRLSAGSSSDPFNRASLDAFRQGLRELGWNEGTNLFIEARWGGDKEQNVRDFAAELARMQVDVIVAVGSPMVAAAKSASTTIPIVMAGSGADPVTAGFVESLARPGKNITGMTLLSTELSSKRLELLKQVVSMPDRIAVLRNPDFPAVSLQWKEIEAAAKSLGVQLQPYDARKLQDIENAFTAMSTATVRALVVFSDPLLLERHRPLIIRLASKHKLPAVYPWRNYTDEGGLMSYAADLIEMHRRAATYVDKILKGTKPAHLPVEQPTKFELVINLKSAKKIGLTVPPSVLARADRVIR